MTPSMQGFITALLISLLVGVIIGFYLRQARINGLTTALKQSQGREKELEQEHESRLQAATLKLQQDYETQLAEKMEAYQSQYETQLSQMESTYQARQSLIAQGIGDGIAGGNDMASTIEQRIRQQYESRLKEVAHKIQQAYEQHLQAKLVEAREVAQADYDQRLAQVIEHYQDELEQRLAQATPPSVMPMDTPMDISETAAIAATPGQSPREQPTAASSETVALLEDQLRQEYDQRLAEAIEHHQDEMLQRTQALEADFANRLQLLQAAQPEAGSTELGEADRAALRAEIEADLRSQYEQQLAEKIEHYQIELTQRTQEMEQSFAARLAMVEQASPEVAPTDELSEELSSALSSLNVAEIQPSGDDFGALLDFDTNTEAPASPVPEDSGFDIDHLDALLNEAVDEDTPPNQLFDDLDDLNNLS
ncbi:hypothetical protein [Nodosilinea sp. P-1105]|uniref:hypothetical protein n=1 Tax=Nodosilinea sp. P-1105 TaxID=2546229 RepID=UPI00146B1044|nr:hypothetical protein [Nodosilinea sp. P-1105]NMF84778.1 hypothetical protein [Nodosilinea sp. P-1105]